jgi:hypothetical protein
MIKLTGEAESFIGKLTNFSIDDFEKWVYSIEILAGQNQVIQYVDEKCRWNNKCVSKNDKPLRLQLSNQAQSVLKYLPEFNTEEFKIWFNNAIEFTKGDILNFLVEKK